MMHEYGITIDGVFHVINQRRPAVRGPYCRAGLGKRIWKWIRRTAGRASSATMQSARVL